mgnify:CR=1 FL=1
MIETSENVDQLFPALLNSSKKIVNPKMSGSGIYGPYATLADIGKVTKGALLDEGLILMQSAYIGSSGLVMVDTHIFHTTGQFIASKGWANQPEGKNPLFAGGAALTYGRRQALAAMLQLVGELDPEESDVQDRESLIKELEGFFAANKNPGKAKERTLNEFDSESLESMTDEDLLSARDAWSSSL